MNARSTRLRERRDSYRLILSSGLVFSLLLVTVIFRIPFQPEVTLDIVLLDQEIVQMEEIEQTRHQELAPPPPRPPVPIAVADDELLEMDEIMFDSEIRYDEALVANLPPPPAQREEEIVDESEIFVVVEDMPEVIGGIASLQRILEYPEIARRANLEGTVVVQVIIETDGTASNPVVMRSAGLALDEAAVEAVMKLSFKPGMQRGRAVRVHYAIPVQFRLRST